ncbi:MAG: hypothetical protein JXA24_05650 [Proteobacteria bacterium]|nr:hypothetical protein [Pseudomonadota bacterium]
MGNKTGKIPPVAPGAGNAPLAGWEEIAAELEKPRTTQAGYVVDGTNTVYSGPWQGESAALCDSRWGTQTPSVFSLKGLEFSKTEAVCLRKAWGLDRDAFVLDIRKRPMGTYCIEKMDASIYKSYLNDEQFESYRKCLKEDQVERLNELLTLESELDHMFSKEGVVVGSLGILSMFMIFVWPGHRFGTWIDNGIKKAKDAIKKNGPKDPPAPPASGGGSAKKPVLVYSPTPEGTSQFYAYDPDGLIVPTWNPAPLADAVSVPKTGVAEKLGLIGAGIMGAVLMLIAGPAAMSMGLSGSAAGGAFMVAPGADKGMPGTSNMGPVA